MIDTQVFSGVRAFVGPTVGQISWRIFNHSHREYGGKTPWDGGPLIINPIYTLYHVGILLGPRAPLLKGLQQGG